MTDRWVVPSFIPDRERVARWAPGRIVSADDPSRPTVVWARPKARCVSMSVQPEVEERGAAAFSVHRFDLKEDDLEQWEIVPPMEIKKDAFFIVVQVGSATRMYPVVCEPAPWETGRRAAEREARMEELRKWAEES